MPKQSNATVNTNMSPVLVVKSVSVLKAYAVQASTITAVMKAATKTTCLPAVMDTNPHM